MSSKKRKYEVGEKVWFCYYFKYDDPNSNWNHKCLEQKFTISGVHMQCYVFKETIEITFGSCSSICNFGDPVYES